MLFIPYALPLRHGYTLPPITCEPLKTSLSADIAHDPQRPDDVADDDPENAYEYSSLHLYMPGIKYAGEGFGRFGIM